VNLAEQIHSSSGWLGSPTWEANDRHLARAKASGIRYRHLPADTDIAPGTVSIIKGIGRGVLVTRDTFEYAAVPRIPLWAFLFLQL